MPAIATGGPHRAAPARPGPDTVPPQIDPPTHRSPALADRQALPRRPSARRPPSGRGTSVRVRAGQLVAAQVATALVLATLGRSTPVTVAATLAAALVVAVAVVRVRGRWLFEWLGTATEHVTRRRELAAPAGPSELLELVAPGTVLESTELTGGPAAMLEDTTGMVVLLELGDPGDLLGDASRAIPAPSALLPPAGPDVPPLRVQLLLSGAPAPVPAAAGTVGTSYRQLTDGRLAGRGRAVLAVRVLRVDGWSGEDLRRVLAGTVRRIVRRLGSLAARPLGVPSALRVLGELAHHDGHPVRESWPALRSGALLQATFRLVRWPDGAGGRLLVPRLLALPATATTVSISAGSTPTAAAGLPSELTVRLAAGTATELATAAEALTRLVADLGGELRRLDGAHLSGLGATLPLALAARETPTGPAMDDWELTLGDAGLMVGTNRHGGAVTVRLFRPESTRVLLVGGVRAAQLVALRALALGALVVVQTSRPRAWEPFVRGVGAPGGTIPLIPPGRPVADGVGSALRPLLLVVDAGSAPADTEAGPPWRATLVVRDELTPADVGTLSRADLALLQPLNATEAALAGTALGLGGSAEWLTRIRDDMVAVVNRRALRWALLSPTPIESQLIGRPARG
ncbi:type VII secretion protein EccE [Micromonospora sp. WMMD964]|uniref:type VII secretion protein EccE n=1 Tax=Micromonospora sp. WMMD964 TaxID=3016091 RepID=UPI00249A720C|nr:type VII secretion protein EccE [Micromonospora sp. WMMD964]WFF02488.1 type VII secretion protein EccE [Micromonospora sp. WMMD964]